MNRKRPLSPSTRASSSHSPKRPKPGPFDYSSDSDDGSSEDEAPEPPARPVPIAVPAVKSQKRLNLNLFKERMAKKPVNAVGSPGQLRQDNTQAKEATGLGATNLAMKPAQARLGTGNVQSSKPDGGQGGQTIRNRPASLGSGQANTSINGRVATTGRLTEQIPSRTPVAQFQAKRSAPNSSAPNAETYDRAPPLIQKHALSNKVSLSQVGIIDSVPALKNISTPTKPSNLQLQQQRSGGTPASASTATNKRLPSQAANQLQGSANTSGHANFPEATGTQPARGAPVSTPVLRKPNIVLRGAEAPLRATPDLHQQVPSSSKISDDKRKFASQQARAILQKPPSDRLEQVHSNTSKANGRVDAPPQSTNVTPKTVTGPPQQSRGGLGVANGGNPSASQQAKTPLGRTNSRPQKVTDGQSTVNAANIPASQSANMSSKKPSSPKQQPLDKSVYEEGTTLPAIQPATNTPKISGAVTQEARKLPTSSAGQMEIAAQPAKAPFKADGYPHHLQLFKNSTGTPVEGNIQTAPATSDMSIAIVEQARALKAQEKTEKPQLESKEKMSQSVGGPVEPKVMKEPISPLEPKDAWKAVSLPINVPRAKPTTNLGERDENKELSLAGIHSQKKFVNYDSDAPPSAHPDGSPVKKSGPSSDHPSTAPPGTLQDISRSHHHTEASQLSRDASVNPKLVPSTLDEVSKQPKEASAAEKEAVVPSVGAQHIEALKHFNFSPSHPGIAIPMDQMRFEVPKPLPEPIISKSETQKQVDIPEPMDIDILGQEKPTTPATSPSPPPTITTTPQFPTLNIPPPPAIATDVTPVPENPFFTYHIYQTLSTSPPTSHSTSTPSTATLSPTELTHPHTTLSAANTAAQTLIHSLQTYPSIYPITILSFHLTHDVFGCVNFEARFVSEGEPEVQRVHRIFVARKEGVEMDVCGRDKAEEKGTRDVAGVGTSVFAVRLGRVLEGGSVTSPSDSDSDDSDSNEDDDSDDSANSPRTPKHSTSNPSASKSNSKSEPSTPPLRNEIHVPLPTPFAPIHTTLTSANRLARRLQIHLSHSPNPTSPMEKMWQEKDRQELQVKIEALERYNREEEARGDDGEGKGGDKGGHRDGENEGYWKSEFNGAGKGGERFVLRVERVGLVGPRNI